MYVKYEPNPVRSGAIDCAVRAVSKALDISWEKAYTMLSVNGEPRLTSRAIYTPAAVEEFGNVTSTAIIKVPRCCCFSLSVDAVPATTDPTVTPAPVIEVQNANLTITRIA